MVHQPQLVRFESRGWWYGIRWKPPITALNNATENELVTVGSTTTELDGEANLTFDGSQLDVEVVHMPPYILQELVVEMPT